MTSHPTLKEIQSKCGLSDIKQVKDIIEAVQDEVAVDQDQLKAVTTLAGNSHQAKRIKSTVLSAIRMKHPTISALDVNTRVLVENGLWRNAVTLGKSRLLSLIQESDSAKTGELESAGKGLSRHRSKSVESTASRASSMSVKSTGTIQMSRLALEADIEFNPARFGFQSFTILDPDKTPLTKIPIHRALNDRMRQKMEDGLIEQSKIAPFMLSFDAFEEALRSSSKTEPFCARGCTYLFLPSRDRIECDDDLAAAANSFVLYPGTELQIILDDPSRQRLRARFQEGSKSIAHGRGLQNTDTPSTPLPNLQTNNDSNPTVPSGGPQDTNTPNTPLPNPQTNDGGSPTAPVRRSQDTSPSESLPKDTPPPPSGPLFPKAASTTLPSKRSATNSITPSSPAKRHQSTPRTPHIPEVPDEVRKWDLTKVRTLEEVPWTQMKTWAKHWIPSKREKYISDVQNGLVVDKRDIKVGTLDHVRTWTKREDLQRAIEENDKNAAAGTNAPIIDDRQAHIDPLTWTNTLRFFNIPLTMSACLQTARFHILGLSDGISLYPYQLLGNYWMHRMCGSFVGGLILGDAMGLGKTAQMIAFWVTSAQLDYSYIQYQRWLHNPSRDNSIHLSPINQPKGGVCPSQIPFSPTCPCVRLDSDGTDLYFRDANQLGKRVRGATLVIQKTSIFHQTVEAFESFTSNKKVCNVMGGRLNVRILHGATGNLTPEEVKNYLTPTKHVQKIEGEEYTYYAPNPMAATFVIITTADTLSRRWGTILCPDKNGDPRCTITTIITDEFHTGHLPTSTGITLCNRINCEQERYCFNSRSVRNPSHYYTQMTLQKETVTTPRWELSRPAYIFASGTPLSHNQYTVVEPVRLFFKPKTWAKQKELENINSDGLEAIRSWNNLVPKSKESAKYQGTALLKDKTSSAIIENLFLLRKPLNQWFDGRVINEMPVLKHYTIYVESPDQFKSYVVTAWSDAVKELEDTLATQYKQWQDKGCKGDEPSISESQLASTARLARLYASWPALAQVKAEWKSDDWTSEVDEGSNEAPEAPRFTSKQILSEKWDEPTNENPLWSRYWHIISQSPKLQQLSDLLDILDEHWPDDKLLIASDFPITCVIISLLLFKRYGRKYTGAAWLHSGLTAKQRSELCDRHNTPTKNTHLDPIRFLILGIGISAEGLNLCGGSRSILMEPQYSPAKEDQFFCRQCRSGQPEHICFQYTFVCRDRYNRGDSNVLTHRLYTGRMTKSVWEKFMASCNQAMQASQATQSQLLT